jgi:DNA-binding response OmpR family regulator
MPRLLIIEDDLKMRDLLREHLSDGYELLETGDAAEALALVLQHKPDGILLDLMLPEFSGFELCQTFSSLSLTRLVPVFVITSKPASEYRQFCLNLGAAEYIEKPVDFARLKMLLDAVLDSKPTERRTEPRLSLSLVLKLKGIDVKGESFAILTAADDVSASGFLANCPAPLENGATVEVFLGGQSERYAGRAQVVRTEWPEMPWQRYGFHFLEKPRHWILGSSE